MCFAWFKLVKNHPPCQIRYYRHRWETIHTSITPIPGFWIGLIRSPPSTACQKDAYASFSKAQILKQWLDIWLQVSLTGCMTSWRIHTSHIPENSTTRSSMEEEFDRSDYCSALYFSKNRVFAHNSNGKKKKKSLYIKFNTFKESKQKLFQIRYFRFHSKFKVLGNGQRVQWVETWPAKSSIYWKNQSLIRGVAEVFILSS